MKRATVLALITLAAVGCRKAVQSSLFACVPAEAALAAGVDLPEIRRWPLYERLPVAWRAALTPIQPAQSAIVALDSKELLLAARGHFIAPPPGAVMAAPDVALFGPAEPVKAAAESYRGGSVARTPLIAAAESVAPGSPVWLVARGDADLPLPGNVANFLGILRKARLVTLTVRRSGALEFDLKASAPDENAARAIEETLRADLTLAAVAEAKRPDVAALLKKASVTRDGLDVEVRFAATDESAARLLGM